MRCPLLTLRLILQELLGQMQKEQKAKVTPPGKKGRPWHLPALTSAMPMPGAANVVDQRAHPRLDTAL